MVRKRHFSKTPPPTITVTCFEAPSNGVVIKESRNDETRYLVEQATVREAGTRHVSTEFQLSSPSQFLQEQVSSMQNANLTIIPKQQDCLTLKAKGAEAIRLACNLLKHVSDVDGMTSGISKEMQGQIQNSVIGRNPPDNLYTL